MDAKKAMEQYKGRIDAALKKYLDKKLKETFSPETREMLRLIREYNLRGGKRIRPILVVYGHKCFSEGDEEKLIFASLAVELMEAYLLVHDDIMDRDSVRRGGKTMHCRYEEIAHRYQKGLKADPSQFGVSMGIIAGDVIATLGNEVLCDSDFTYDRKIKVLRLFNDIIRKTCFGQMHDIISEAKDNVSEKEILRTHELKTAAYTIEGPLQIGATLAGADEKQIAMLSRFAIPIGIAFQIQDDILGMFGSSEKTGKPVGSDLIEGKKTLLIVKALEKAGKDDKESLRRCLGNRECSESDIEKVREIIRKTGSLEYSKRLCAKLLNKGAKEIRKAKIRDEAKEFLLGIADYLAKREF